MTERNNWVDYAKAIGILLVIYGHSARGIRRAGIEVNDSLYVLIDSIIYSFHMPLFFFLSGLFFYDSYAKRGATGLVAVKIDTIAYPYILWSTIQGAIAVQLSSFTTSSLDFSYIYSVFWWPKGQFWFLYALFFIFMIVTLIFALFPQKLARLVLILTVPVYIYQLHFPNITVLGYITGNLVFFALGMLFNQLQGINKLDNICVLLSLTCLFIISQYAFHTTLNMNYMNKGVISLFLALIGILFVVSLSALLARKPMRWLLYIGASSMGIYLMHILACSGARIILQRIFGIESDILHLMIGCLAGLTLPLIAIFIINKLRFKYVFSAPISRIIFR